MRFVILISVFTLAGGTLFAGGGIPFQQDLATLAKQGRGTPEGRSAWDRLSQADADLLPAILTAMNVGDTSAVNWLRLAFDHVVDNTLKANRKIDQAKLLAFARNAANQGRPRRLALELVDRLTPGAAETMYLDSLDDPEFRYEAVALVLTKAKRADVGGNSLIASNLSRQAFDKGRDLVQLREAALGLEKAKIKVSIAQQMGFITAWHLIGPFDGKGQKGLQTAYPPEAKVDLAEELDGQKGKVRWKLFQVKEPTNTSTDRHQALVSLRDKAALGNADDAVAFAYAEFHVDQAMKAEMRGSADDNFAVFVNGAKAFSFEEWRNGVRHDRHRFPVELRAGKNSVLVKVSQSAPPNTEPNWEFFLRVVDATGKGVLAGK